MPDVRIVYRVHYIKDILVDNGQEISVDAIADFDGLVEAKEFAKEKFDGTELPVTIVRTEIIKAYPDRKK